jgi:hypothetical protein
MNREKERIRTWTPGSRRAATVRHALNDCLDAAHELRKRLELDPLVAGGRDGNLDLDGHGNRCHDHRAVTKCDREMVPLTFARCIFTLPKPS